MPQSLSNIPQNGTQQFPGHAPVHPTCQETCSLGLMYHSWSPLLRCRAIADNYVNTPHLCWENCLGKIEFSPRFQPGTPRGTGTKIQLVLERDWSALGQQSLRFTQVNNKYIEQKNLWMIDDQPSPHWHVCQLQVEANELTAIVKDLGSLLVAPQDGSNMIWHVC